MEIDRLNDDSADDSVDEIESNLVKVKKYSSNILEQALDDISAGMSVYKAAKLHNIPKSTLQDRKAGKGFGKRGRKTMFTAEEEQDISKWLIKCAETGGPRTKEEFLNTVREIHQQKTGDPSVQIQSNDWLKLFMTRNQGISFRTAQAVTRSSACVSEDDIRRWFTTIQAYLAKEDLLHLLNDSSRWINCDETGFELNPRPGKVLAAKGAKNVNFVETAHPSERVSVMYTFSADGHVFSPQMILKNSVSGNKLVEMAKESVGEFNHLLRKLNML